MGGAFREDSARRVRRQPKQTTDLVGVPSSERVRQTSVPADEAYHLNVATVCLFILIPHSLYGYARLVGAAG